MSDHDFVKFLNDVKALFEGHNEAAAMAKIVEQVWEQEDRLTRDNSFAASGAVTLAVIMRMVVRIIGCEEGANRDLVATRICSMITDAVANDAVSDLM